MAVVKTIGANDSVDESQVNKIQPIVFFNSILNYFVTFLNHLTYKPINAIQNR